MKSICVIGAGITGITTAYELAKKGHKVTVIDKHPYAAMQTSYANGGQLSVSNSEVWTNWQTVFKGAKWLFKKDAPLLVNPSPSIPKLKWMTGFLLNTILNKSQANTQETVRLGLIAREEYNNIISNENIEFNHQQRGILHFYRNNKSFDEGQQSSKLLTSMGLDRQVITTQQVVDIEPSLRFAQHKIVGGTYTHSDSSGDIHQFCTEMAKILDTKYNVVFKYDTTVTDLFETGNHIVVSSASLDMFGHEISEIYDTVVVCGGVDSPSITKMIGEHINVYPVKGYSITVNLDSESSQLAPQVSLLDEETKIVSSTYLNRLRVAGTAELAGWNYDIKANRVKPLVTWVREMFPQVQVKDVKPWAGLRPMTPSMLPICRPSKASKRVIINTGHGHLGWTLAPATALSVSNYIYQIQ